jgi:hypothetical protein
MGLPGVLEVIIGLVFVYFLVSVLCSGLNEMIAHQVGRRGEFLREGMINLVRDRWIYLRIINHPLVSSMYRDVPGKPRTPAYIPAGSFAHALIDIMLLKASQLDPAFQPGADVHWKIEDLRKAAQLCKASGYSIGDAMLPLIDAAQSDPDQARKNIEAWFEGGMQRVSGWYKKSAQRILLMLGFVVAIVFNVDTLQIATQLSQSADLRKSVADAATRVVETRRFDGVALNVTDDDVKVAQEDLKQFAGRVQQLDKLGLPIGFSCLSPLTQAEAGRGFKQMARECYTQAKKQDSGAWVLKAAGWLITGLAVALGAPFWFDLLNKLVNLRGSGPRPSPVPQPDTKPKT